MNGKSLRRTIGVHGVFTADMARKEARLMLADFQKGIDKKQIDEETRENNITILEALDDYIKSKVLKKKTSYNYDKCVKDVFKNWLNKPLMNINIDIVVDRFKSIDRPGYANSCFKALRAIINFSNEKKLMKGVPISSIPINPCKILKINHLWHKLERR